jgi:Fe-S oxidoreductase
MFKPELCDLCGECLTRCQWMDVKPDQAFNWMAQMRDGHSTPVLEACITCYACNETCPQGANPFDLIAELQEKHCQLVPRDNVEASEAAYIFNGELKAFPQADRIMSVCVFEKTDGHLIQGELYDLPRVGGKPYFCWIIFSHMGATSVQARHAQTLVNRLALTGAKEVVCFHDDCYAMLAKLAPAYGIDVPFRPIHLAEYLVTYLRANQDRIQSLDLSLAYQRPCASRHTPEKEHFIDELFDLAGCRRVARAYDRTDALCCAGTMLMLGQGDPRSAQEKNIQDAIDSGAQALVCLCPMCMHMLAGIANEHNLPLIFLGDMARMALGEMESPL